MSMHARLRTLFVLVSLGTPFAVCGQSPHSPDPHAILSVEPSGPGLYHAVGIEDTEFRFSIDVTDVSGFVLRFGDGNTVECELLDQLNCSDTDGGAVDCELNSDNAHEVVCTHLYGRLDDYTAELNVTRRSGEALIPLTLPVLVKTPPPVPEPVPSVVRFSAALSARIHDDVKFPEADYTFTARVEDAESYELRFGDKDENGKDIVLRNIDPEIIEPGSPQNGLRHVYLQPGEYTAKVTAWSNTGDRVENELVVVVLEPPAPPAPPDVFSVQPGDPNSLFGAGPLDTEFVFAAEVAGAHHYELEFGDGDTVEREIPAGAASTAVRFSPHRYNAPGDYTAVLNASRGAGGPVRMALGVSVDAPQVPQPGRPDWAWLLILAAVAVLLGTFVIPTPVAMSSGDVTFEPRADLGRVRLVGEVKTDEAVTLRVQKDTGRVEIKGRVAIKQENGERQ